MDDPNEDAHKEELVKLHQHCQGLQPQSTIDIVQLNQEKKVSPVTFFLKSIPGKPTIAIDYVQIVYNFHN